MVGERSGGSGRGSAGCQKDSSSVLVIVFVMGVGHGPQAGRLNGIIRILLLLLSKDSGNRAVDRWTNLSTIRRRFLRFGRLRLVSR